MKFLIFFACIVFAAANVSVNDEFYCFAADPVKPQRSMFSTQSSYEATRGRRIDPTVSSCQPSRFWLVMRHGGRNPPASDISLMRDFVGGPFRENILLNHEEGRSTACLEDIENLRNWQGNTNLTVEQDSLLTVSGWNIMLGVAHRYQIAFPTLLPLTYNRPDFQFRHTDRQRSQGSVRAFSDGLFGSRSFERVTFESVPGRDTLLRPQDFCPAFGAISNATVEQEAFEQGPEFLQMLEQVNTKLGFSGSEQLNSRQIRTIWEWCRFEDTSDILSPWCFAFSIANHAVLDYYEDLNFYYNQGYGLSNRRLTENLNCELMQDLLRYLQSNSTSDPRVKVFGTHSSTLQLFLVSMGFFEDEFPMTRHNFAQQILRQWRTGIATPKGANLAVVRYDCANGDNEALFLWNERPIQIPGCQRNGLCKISTVIARYHRFVNANCNNLFCSSD